MSGVVGIILVGAVLLALYAFGYLPTAGLVHAYKRVRLAAILWIAFILIVGLSRAFDFP